jgi:hypothetical protein
MVAIFSSGKKNTPHIQNRPGGEIKNGLPVAEKALSVAHSFR